MYELSGKLREISRRSQVLFSAAVGTEREDNRGTVWRDRVLRSAIFLSKRLRETCSGGQRKPVGGIHATSEREMCSLE